MEGQEDDKPADDSLSDASGCSTDEPPMCVDEMDAVNINRWFDYWCHEDEKTRSRPYHDKTETINKIRRLALAGSSKARRNNKAVAAVLADVLESMAKDLRDGNGKIVGIQ